MENDSKCKKQIYQQILMEKFFFNLDLNIEYFEESKKMIKGKKMK